MSVERLWPAWLAGIVLLTAGCASSGPSREEVAQVNYELGVAYWRQGHHQVAQEKLRKALKADPMRAEIHSALGLVYEARNRHEAAKEHHQTAVGLVSKDSEAYGVVHNNYGAFLCRRGDLDEAMAHFERAIENPFYETPEAAFENIGVCALGIPDPERAEGAFRSALQLNGRMPTALLGMARVKMRQDNTLAARAFLQRYHQVAQATPGTLWLGFRIERALGEAAEAQRYAQRLTVQFPESNEAKQLEDLDKAQEER